MLRFVFRSRACGRGKPLVMKKAFSIAELVIVVCIIGILAALVVPVFQGQATEAKVSAAKDNLRVLRSAIELYASQHKGASPGYENDDVGTAPSAETFRVQLTVQEHFMRKVPVNPFNNLDTLQMVANGEASLPEPTGTCGWIYQASTGTIRLDWRGNDAGGVAYFDY